MRKRAIACIVFLFLSAVVPAHGAADCSLADRFASPDNGGRLLALLASLLIPESLELRMDEPPDEAGNIRNLSAVVRGGRLTGFRVERLALESSFLELPPPASWRLGDAKSLAVRGALRTNTEIVLLEEDINAALAPYATEQYRLSVDLKPGGIRLRVNFTMGSAGFRSLAEVDAGLEIGQGGQLRLKTPRIVINGDDQTDAVEQELLKIQPFVDFAAFGLPPNLVEISVDEDSLRLSSRTPPKPVEGLLYRYDAPAVSSRPRIPYRAPRFSSELFRDGDIVFANGKGWRTKIVRLFDKSPRGYSHAGIVRLVGGLPYVVHASPELGRVGMQSMEDFLSFESVDFARVYRFTGDPAVAEAASLRAFEFCALEIPFDDRFDTGNREAMYCTELIWRAYKSAGVDLAEGNWEFARNPVVQGRVLMPYRLSRSPRLAEAFTME